MAWEGLNIEDLNASRLNSTLLGYTLLNASIETRETGGIAPVPPEDYLRLKDGILLKDGSPLLLKDGAPLALERIENTD